jgi:hypothetical protein
MEFLLGGAGVSVAFAAGGGALLALGLFFPAFYVADSGKVSEI